MNEPSRKPTRTLLNTLWEGTVQNTQGLVNFQTLAALFLLLGYPLFDGVPKDVLFKVRHYITSHDIFSSARDAEWAPLIASHASDDVRPTRGSDLVFITLDDAYAIQHRSPRLTPRAYLDSLLRAVLDHEPRVVALDFKFSTADLTDPDYARLCERLASASNRGITVVLPTAVQAEQDWYRVLPFPPAGLRHHSLAGYANLRGRPVEYADLTRPVGPTGARVPSFALSALVAYVRPDDIADAQSATPPPDPGISCTSDGPPGASAIGVWQKVLPETLDATLDEVTGGRRVVPINYRGPVQAGVMQVHSAETLFRVPGAMELVRDKLVLIGATFDDPDGYDTFRTPFGDMRGASVHATVLHELLDGHRLVAVSGWMSLLVCLGLGLFTFLVAFRYRFRMLLITGGIAAGYAVTSVGLFTLADVLLPAGPGLAVIGVTGLILHGASRLWYPCARTHIRLRCAYRDVARRVRQRLPSETMRIGNEEHADDTSSVVTAAQTVSSRSAKADPPEPPPFIDADAQSLTSPLNASTSGGANGTGSEPAD